MRITGGKAGGIPLKTGKSEVRPATDRLREAVFSSLGRAVIDARFFDLFAGSGAYGLEAWSRGARSGLFIEKNRRMGKELKQNARAVARSLNRPEAEVEVVVADVTRWKSGPGDRADLIFADPPYPVIEDVWPGLFVKFDEWLSPEGVIVFETPGGLLMTPEGWDCFKRLGKGRHQPGCSFFRRLSTGGR